MIFDHYYAVHLCPRLLQCFSSPPLLPSLSRTLSLSLSLYLKKLTGRFRPWENTQTQRDIKTRQYCETIFWSFFISFHTHLQRKGAAQVGGRRVKVQRPVIKNDKGGIKNRLVSLARFALRLAGGVTPWTWREVTAVAVTAAAP